ncbi:hypothetical protein FN846DRAFT_928798 [Sphaerosporella brunnea]|uniref:Uncharacterized protein n=1 Tax=Sphaerosporella brunnea TaxID=1250544 RepID=A0A5J5F8X2_9PEZI|nr:hypothetical protein FN846DRAFT_928798 [Sphaerosporella brunnea]
MSASDNAFAGIPDGAPIKFETWEHITIGDALLLTTAAGEKVVAWQKVLKTVDGVELTLGKVLGFAGDYYTVPGNHAITGDYGKPTPSFETQIENARKAINALRGNYGGYIKPLEKLFVKEQNAVEMAIREGGSAAVAYSKGTGLPSDLSYSLATKLLYPRISWNNFDHFGNDARSAYTACHTVALGLAANANGNEDALNEAYLADAFALHFLTDSFSSGHMRAPRRALHDNNPLTAFPSGMVGAPVWDTQSRYMHDEDAALGLWVHNDEGSEWIAFGDKQYFDGHNRINRLRCQDASQASIDEIHTAFTTGKVPGTSSFAALKKAPKPQLAEGKGWSYDNFSPLWVYDPTSKAFSARQDVDDHSKYQREAAHPGYVALQWPPLTPSKMATKIKNSAYKTAGMYPPSKPMEPASGGFVQVQEVVESNANGSKRVISYANVWGPVNISLNTADANLTFSLRNRSRGFSEHDASIHTLGWSKFFDQATGRTSFVRFTLSAGDNSDVKTDCWSFVSNKTSQVIAFDDLDATPLVFGAPDFTNHTLVRNFKGHGLSSARFFIESWLSTTEANIIAVTFGGGTLTPRITVASLDGSAPAIDFIDTAGPKLAWGHSKLLNIGGAKRLLLACAVPDPHGLSTELILRDYTSTESGSLAVNQTSIELPGTAGVHTQVLVGDVLATGTDQLVVLLGARVQLYTITAAAASSQLVYTPTATPSSSTATEIPTRSHILTALLPSSSSSSSGGLDILSITTSTSSTLKPTLNFTLSARGGPGATTILEDPLQEDPHFASISWHRAEYQDAKNAVMQVFSWYGMLGTRLFAPGGDDGYELVGCCTSMGQTASTTILEWGPTEGWVDFAEYNPRPEM